MFEPEEKQIAERIKTHIKREKIRREEHIIMLRNGRILEIFDYLDMVNSGKINPQDAYVYIGIDWSSDKSIFYYQFLPRYYSFVDAYLSKLGFYYKTHVSKLGFYYKIDVVPATGLKYVAGALYYKDYLSIEVSNLDVVANNANLRKVVFEVLGGKIISKEKKLTREKYYDILEIMFESQQLFAGHNRNEASDILYNYYKGNQSLVKEVARIVMDYDRIFQPYRVCYDMKTWNEVDCWSIKLD